MITLEDAKRNTKRNTTPTTINKVATEKADEKESCWKKIIETILICDFRGFQNYLPKTKANERTKPINNATITKGDPCWKKKIETILICDFTGPEKYLLKPKAK